MSKNGTRAEFRPGANIRWFFTEQIAAAVGAPGRITWSIFVAGRKLQIERQLAMEDQEGGGMRAQVACACLLAHYRSAGA